MVEGGDFFSQLGELWAATTQPFWDIAGQLKSQFWDPAKTTYFDPIVVLCADIVRLLTHRIVSLMLSRKLHDAMLGMLALAAFAVFTFAVSIPAYLVFYNLHLPEKLVEVPIYLQYGYGANPFAVASLTRTNLKTFQGYDIEVALTMPDSPANLARGTFMVGLMLLSGDQQSEQLPPPRYQSQSGPITSLVAPIDVAGYTANRQVLYASTRPTRLPYRSALVGKAAALLRLPYYALFPGTETSTVVVRMAERLKFPRGATTPTGMVLEIQAGQGMQVYEAKMTVIAHLTGIRYFMYQYRVTSCVVFTMIFWAVTMFMFVVIFGLIPLVMPQGGTQGKIEGSDGDPTPTAIKQEGEKDTADEKGQQPAIKQEADLSDTERSFPSSSKHPALKYEGSTKREGSEVPEPPSVNPGALADDEDEEDPRAKDSGVGTSMSDNFMSDFRKG